MSAFSKPPISVAALRNKPLKEVINVVENQPKETRNFIGLSPDVGLTNGDEELTTFRAAGLASSTRAELIFLKI